MVIAVDDDDLENEGSLLVAGEFAHTRSYQLYGNQCQRFDHYANF